MKTTIEMNGFEIVITEQEGSIIVSAVKDDETVEEFTLEVEATEDGDNVQATDDDGMLPFDAQEEPELGEDEVQATDDVQSEVEEDGIKLESFTSFIEKRK